MRATASAKRRPVGPLVAAWLLVQALGLFFLAGCAGKRGPAHFTPERYPALGLEAEAAGLEITDTRTGAAPLDLPRVIGPSRRTFVKSLSQPDSAALLGEVRRNLTGTGPAMHFQVAVERADLALAESFLKLEEIVNVKVRIGILLGTARLAECTGSSFLERKSPMVRQPAAEALFREALEMAVHGCLESTREELKKSIRAVPGGGRI